ncbi:MAG TPA: hypothetical protein VG270_11230, partial [Pseudolabrys sp.]|nr:hypothetical protein [Pseudolabrys sp.]
MAKVKLRGVAGMLYGNPTIGICVSYKFAFEPTMLEGEIHKSAVAIQLFKKGEPGGGRIRPDKTIPLDQLVINGRS